MTGYIFGKMILHSYAKKFVESYLKMDTTSNIDAIMSPVS